MGGGGAILSICSIRIELKYAASHTWLGFCIPLNCSTHTHTFSLEGANITYFHRKYKRVKIEEQNEEV